MKKSIIFASVVMLMMISCDKKKDHTSNIIIAHKPLPHIVQQPASTQEGDYTQERSIDWIGQKYNVIVTRAKDESLPATEDEQGKEYYDNVITIRIVRPDGTDAFNHVFRKRDFEAYFGESQAAKDGALLGIVLDKVEGEHLIFAASVGSPDFSSDNYCPLRLTISRNGSYSIEKDNSLI